MKLRIIMIAVLVLLGPACQDQRSALSIINSSGDKISNVQISDRERSWLLGSIKYKEKKRFSEKLKGEGGLYVTWVYKNRKYKDIGCYYTSGINVDGTVFIYGKSAEWRC